MILIKEITANKDYNYGIISTFVPMKNKIIPTISRNDSKIFLDGIDIEINEEKPEEDESTNK